MAHVKKVELALFVPDFSQDLLVDVQWGQGQETNVEFERHCEVLYDLNGDKSTFR